MISRKQFILTSSLGLFSVLVPSRSFIGGLFLDPIKKDNLKELLKAAKKLRKGKKFDAANSAYNKLINDFPSEIRGYNGLRRNLLSKKGNELSVVNLYLKALGSRPDNIRLRHMLYTQYFDIAMGHKSLVPMLNLKGRVLLVVRDGLAEIAEKHPEKKNIISQLTKVNKYIEYGADQTDPHKNKALKIYRKEQKDRHKKRFDYADSRKAKALLENLEAKSFSKDRVQHIREMYKVNVKALRKEKKYTEALAVSQSYLSKKNNNDPYFIKEFRSLAKYLGDFNRLLEFETENHRRKKSFWSGIALFDAHIKGIVSKKGGSLSLLSTILPDLEKKVYDPNQAFELAVRKIKFSVLNQNLTEAREQIILQLKRMRAFPIRIQSTG